MTRAPKTAAVYARFSTDRQNERSTADQIDLCRAYAAREGLAVIATFEDKAKSGASIIGRSGLGDMLRESRMGRFDVIIVEALDRLSRDMEDLAGIYKDLSFLGIEIRAVHEGVANTMLVGLRGLVGQLYREDNVHKVRRGMTGLVKQGRSAGGRAYGYRPNPARKGELVIVETEAETVTRIFEEYAAGKNPRDIARDLNRDGVPPPRGNVWNASTINGNKTRGHGMLLNEIYAGRLVWNRVRMVKDPKTGKRISRPNPREEWHVVDAPHLRIVSDELWATVQARKMSRSHEMPERRQKPRHVLSGLLRCGACGSGMRVHDRDRSGRTRIRCSRHSESGACDHSRRYYLDAIERTVLDGLRETLASPKALAEYVRTYHEEMRALSAAARRDRVRLERRLGEVKRSLDRLVDAIADGSALMSSIAGRINDLEAEKIEIERELASCGEEEKVISLHPGIIAQYERDLETLAEGLTGAFGDGDQRAVEALRSLVESVTVMPAELRQPVDICIRGRLTALIDHDVFPTKRMVGGQVVAEEGLEPPTRGL